MNDDETPQNDISKHHTNQHYRDYEVHLLIEDVGEESNYLLKIGTVFERHTGELTGASMHGTLVLKRLDHQDDEPDRFMPHKHWQDTMPPFHDNRPNA